jgi:outer membrane protein assembly factor BamB
MQRRRWIVLGAMWAVALAAVALIYVSLEPEPPAGRAVGGGDAPLHTPDTELAPRESRRELPVGEDEGSPAHYRMGRRHTGRSPARGPTHARRAWQYPASGRITAQAVIGEDGTLYVGDQRRQLHAVSPTGERRWVAATSGPVWSAAGLTGDTVLVGSDADVMLAVGAADGAPRWRLSTEGDADSAISFAPDGTLHFTAGRHLYAVSPEGQIRWRFQARDTFLLSTPAVDTDGTTYVGSIDHHLYAVAADGRMRWDYRSGGEISSSPVIGDDGTLYFGSDDRHVHALTRDGELRWSTDVDGFVRAPVALGRDGSVLAGVYGPRPRLVALDGATGELRWSFPVGLDTSAEAGVASGPIVDVDGNVYFGAQDDFVYSLTPAGRLRWIHRVSSDVDADPVLTPEGLLVVGCDDGFLYAIADDPTAPDEPQPTDGGSPPVEDGPTPAETPTEPASAD